MAGRVKAATRGAELGEVGRPSEWDSVVARPGSTGARWERELIGEAHASAREEREAEDGRRESNKKTYSAEYNKGVRGPSRQMKGTSTCRRGGLVR
jgi:hypothetical protein